MAITWQSITQGLTGQEVADRLDTAFSTTQTELDNKATTTELDTLDNEKQDNIMQVCQAKRTTDLSPSDEDELEPIGFDTVGTLDTSYVTYDAPTNTFNVQQDFSARIVFSGAFGKESSAGSSLLGFALNINGTISKLKAIKMDSTDTVISASEYDLVNLTAGDTVEISFFRDSSGASEGGLRAISTTSFGTAPSANISFCKM